MYRQIDKLDSEYVYGCSSKDIVRSRIIGCSFHHDVEVRKRSGSCDRGLLGCIESHIGR